MIYGNSKSEPEDENLFPQRDALFDDLHEYHHLAAVLNDSRHVVFHQLKRLQQTPLCSSLKT